MSSPPRPEPEPKEPLKRIHRRLGRPGAAHAQHRDRARKLAENELKRRAQGSK